MAIVKLVIEIHSRGSKVFRSFYSGGKQVPTDEANGQTVFPEALLQASVHHITGVKRLRNILLRGTVGDIEVGSPFTVTVEEECGLQHSRV